MTDSDTDTAEEEEIENNRSDEESNPLSNDLCQKIFNSDI